MLLKKKNKKKIYASRFNTSRDTIKIYDENDNLIIDTEYEILGSYYPATKLWTWAWANPGFYLPQNYLSKEILNHAIGWGRERSDLKSMLINSRTLITDTIQLDVNLALSASIIKHYYVYPHRDKNKTEMIHYLILLNETDLDKLGKNNQL